MSNYSTKKIFFSGIALCLLVLLSCSHEKEGATLFPKPDGSRIAIKYTQLHVDTIRLNDEGVECSLSGFSGVNHDGDYYFVDSRLCRYYVFDVNGNFKKYHLGYGPGPKETTAGIELCCMLPDTSLFMLGTRIDYLVYDKNFDKKTHFMSHHSHITASDVPDLSADWRTYSHDVICRTYNNKIYIGMFSEHSEFNYLENTKAYLKKSNHILEADLASEHVGKMYATGYPPIYHEHPYDYSVYSYRINFDIDRTGNFYVSYEADSLIYKYDSDYNPLCSFGYAGTNIRMKISSVSGYSGMKNYFKTDIMNNGFYDWLEYVDETGLLFRSYKKGSHEASDGLQIYSDTGLLADVAVPKDLKVAGYVAPYYYSQAIADPEKETLTVYRFKLSE
ncbi:MAG: hypothetical protein LBT48_01105 [Prevotellaceae bacterium]|jgi:hypothetical protein|nr:hypothetical protein [Prevotellaceae bacterium]